MRVSRAAPGARVLPRLGLLLALTLLGACASSKVSVSVTRPAQLDLLGHRHLVMWGVTGDTGALIADRVSQAVFDSSRFDIVDHANLARVLSQQGLQLGDAFSPEAQALIGKLTGATAAVVGRVNLESFHDPVTATPFERTEEDAQGNAIIRRHTRYVRDGLARLDLSLQVTDLGTGTVIARQSLGAERTQRTESVDAPPARIDAEGLMLECVDSVCADFMQAIVPHEEQVRITLYRGDGLFQVQRQAELERGIEQGRAGRWNAAAASFAQAVERYDSAPGSVELLARSHYNHGLALALDRRCSAALAALDRALALQADSSFRTARTWVERLQADFERLQRQVGPTPST
ncbi:MAG: hypothetical protein DRQ55_15925 [Planctomycetota bacterium]|nr:MAG: hypothetical protein DRQ55_15925 [Planctomycetota bacterium]